MKPGEEFKLPANGPIVPPVPENPGPMSSNVTPTPDIVPAATSKESTTKAPAIPAQPNLTLPELPSMIDPLGPDIPLLPAIPTPSNK